MHYEENYMAYVENERGCCTVTCKLRKKRHLIIIIVLLILAIVSLVTGMYNGLALKKYSNLALVVGIFFPSIILVFVCIYLAFACGRESFPSLLSRARNSSSGNHSRRNKDDLQYFQTNAATLNDLSVRNQFKLNTNFVNGSAATVNEESPFNEAYYIKNDSTDYCEAKISRRHFRSFSNADISKEIMSKNHNTHSKKSEVNKVSCRKNDENQCSSRFLRYDVPKHRGFKRSVSDTVNRNKNTKSREDRYVWNTQSLRKLRSHVDRLNSTQNATKESSRIPSFEDRRKQIENFFLRSNFKTTVEYGNRMRFKEDEVYDKKDTKRQGEYVSPREDVQEKSCYTKSEISLYSSNVPSYKYKQTLKITSFQPDIKDVKDSGDAVCSSLSEDENSGSISLSDILKMERKKMESRRLGNSTSEQDANCLRRKTIYFPSTSNNETTRPLKEYAHEYCRHSNNDSKMKHHLPSRNEEKNWRSRN